LEYIPKSMSVPFQNRLCVYLRDIQATVLFVVVDEKRTREKTLSTRVKEIVDSKKTRETDGKLAHRDDRTSGTLMKWSGARGILLNGGRRQTAQG